MIKIKELDIVALTENIETTHDETGEIIILSKGQIGAVVMEFDENVFEVEFANKDGTTLAMETLPNEKLMLLHHELVALAV